jgi:hypothetical protein
MSDADLISQSLERAGERLGDPTPAIFARLFVLHPQFERLFVMDTDGSVRGSMIETAVDCILGHVEGRSSARVVLGAERERHPGYGVPDEQFGALFTVMRDVFRDGLGADWTAEMDRAWAGVLAALDPAPQRASM